MIEIDAATAGNTRLEKPLYPPAGKTPVTTPRYVLSRIPTQNTGAACAAAATTALSQSHADPG